MKFNRWAIAVANATAVVYAAATASLYIWGETAVNYVEKIHFINLSDEMVSLQVTPAAFGWGLVTHYITAYVFTALVIFFHDRVKGK